MKSCPSRNLGSILTEVFFHLNIPIGQACTQEFIKKRTLSTGKLDFQVLVGSSARISEFTILCWYLAVSFAITTLPNFLQCLAWSLAICVLVVWSFAYSLLPSSVHGGYYLNSTTFLALEFHWSLIFTYPLWNKRIIGTVNDNKSATFFNNQKCDTEHIFKFQYGLLP